MPFGKPDLILRSSDGILIPVVKHALAVASPVINDMLVVGSPEAPGEQNNEASSTPVITLSEDSKTLYHFLQISHMLFDDLTAIATPEAAFQLYQAGDKYNSQRVQDFAIRKLHKLSSTGPAAVFGFACKLRSQALAITAARAFMSISTRDILRSSSPYFVWCTVEQLQSLFAFRDKCSTALQELTSPLTWAKSARAGPSSLSGFSVKLREMDGPPWDPKHLYDGAVRSHCCPWDKISTVPSAETGPLSRRWWWWYKEWWAAYLGDMHSQMLRIADEGRSIAAEKEALYRAVANASKCEACRASAPKTLFEFADILAKRIEETILAVRVSRRLLRRHQNN